MWGCVSEARKGGYSIVCAWGEGGGCLCICVRVCVSVCV